MSHPASLYKYTSYEGAKAVITNCSLKLSVPQAFNDPFDILLEEALGSEVEEFLTHLMPMFFDLISGELDHSAIREGSMGDSITAINTHLRDLPAEKMAEMREKFVTQMPETRWNLASLRENNVLVVATIRAMLSTYGVFCSSRNKDSLLMWSHYADHHRGVVLELQPDLEHDSALLASRPVRYSDERPLLYRTPRDFLERSLLMSSQASARAILEPLIYTKSREWEYEDEYRLAIPRFVPKGASHEFLSLYPRELSRVYFGCRTVDAHRVELQELARTLNPNVKFHRAMLTRRHYALEWIDD